MAVHKAGKFSNNFNVFHVRALYYTKTLITNKMHKEFYHQL
jgi:hypothetical protein